MTNAFLGVFIDFMCLFFKKKTVVLNMELRFSLKQHYFTNKLKLVKVFFEMAKPKLLHLISQYFDFGLFYVDKILIFNILQAQFIGSMLRYIVQKFYFEVLIFFYKQTIIFFEPFYCLSQ